MIDKALIRAMRGSLRTVLQNLCFRCSVCIQSIDTGVLSFANMKNASVSWRKDDMCLFESKRSTFQIPYKEIEAFHDFPERKQIGIVLRGRILVSIREVQ